MTGQAPEEIEAIALREAEVAALDAKVAAGELVLDPHPDSRGGDHE